MVEWNSLQSIAQGLDLNIFLNKEFLDLVSDEFKGKQIDVTNIQLTVRDQKINEQSDESFDLITIMNRNIKDTFLNRVIIDVNNQENLDKMINAINKLEE